MPKISQCPPRLLVRAAGLQLRGRIHFVRDRIGDVAHDEDEDFEVFRKVILETSKHQPEKAGAILIVRFCFARFGVNVNRVLSLMPIPFIVAQPGFRSKTWMMDRRTGVFQGLYEWDSVEDAETYWTSFPMKLMKKRAVPETLYHEITRCETRRNEVR